MRARGLLVSFTLTTIVLAALLVHFTGRHRQQRAVIERLESEQRALRARLTQMESAPPAQPPLAAPETPPATAAPASRPLRPEDAAARLEQLRLLSQTQERLAAANRNLAAQTARVQEMEESASRHTAEIQTFTAAREELLEKIDSSARLAEALQAELKGKNDRLAGLETANKRLSQQLQQARQAVEKAPKPQAWPVEMEEINRRREALLTSILRRYREITDRYRERPSPEATELSRIQSAVALAEEDLRQLRALNVQAQRLEARLKQQ